MSRVCEITDRKVTAGKSRRHKRGSAGGRSGQWTHKATASNRTFRPNLKVVRVLDNGVPVKMKLSAKAVKMLRARGEVDGIRLRATA